jgi:pimeloyl-ACP methyl ester carboxylesterase
LPDPQLNIKIIGDGEPFVFQHGLGANIAQVEQLLSEVKGFQWIFMDMPGHGNSKLAADCIPSFEFYTDQLVLALDKLGVKKAHFGGISMGAGIAINMALRYPEKVKTLLLVRPAWLDQETPVNLKILLEVSKLMGLTDGIEKFKKEAVFLTINKELPKAANSLLTIFDPEQQKELATVLKAMINDKPYCTIQELRNLDLPCVVIGNDNDPLHPYAMAESTNQNIKGSKLHKVTSRYTDSTAHQKEITELIKKYFLEI